MIKTVKLNTAEDANEFAEIAKRYGDSLFLRLNGYFFPTSLPFYILKDLISLNQSDPIKLRFDDEIISAILLDFKKWIVK